MTARSIGIFTIDFPDPSAINYYNDQFSTLPANISFQYPIRSNIQTLSAKDVERGNDPYGILFVPNLSSDDCKKSEHTHLRSNVTRLSNLPTDANYALIAFAPWFSPPCMLEYFQSARSSPVKAFLVYQPGNSSSTPPVMNDATWGLGDGGSWKVDNKFPTYALASISGGIIAEQLALYSGNVTDAPHGHELQLTPTDYVRLWVTVNTDPGSQLPSLWVFLVIVLGLLILVIGATSVMMHFVQRRRRNSLRQRVISGEVDLEALGVKRLTVPREYLEKLPAYTYTTDHRDAEKTIPRVPAHIQILSSPTGGVEMGQDTTPASRPSSAPTASAVPAGAAPTFSQSTCPICLDDFEPNECQVRELLCHHIFHVDCIDPFLLSNSSLCPICKASVLPVGYCPPRITNVMVRRERMIRRMRARSGANGGATAALPPSPSAIPLPRAIGSLRTRLAGAGSGRRIFSAPTRPPQAPADIEMAGAIPALPHESCPAPTQPEAGTATEGPRGPSTSANRREWARQRAMALLGNRHAPSESEDDDNTGPRWKRGLRKIFPGFR